MEGNNLTSAFRSILSRLRSNAVPDDGIQDALQEAFCRLWRNRCSLSDSGNTEALLSKTAGNIIKDDFRRKARHPELDLNEASDFINDDEDSTLDTYMRVVELTKAVLSERDREILFLRDHDGWEFDDIADKYDITETNVRMIVSRARKSVRSVWNKKR